MRKLSVLLIAALTVSLLLIPASAADDIKLDFSSESADISMLTTGEFHYSWMLTGATNAQGSYHFASTNNPAATVDFCISVLTDRFSPDLTPYNTLRIKWLTSAKVGLTNVLEIAGESGDLTFEFEITDQSYVYDPTAFDEIGNDGFTVTDFDISSLGGKLTEFELFPYYDDINLHAYYFYIESIEFLSETSENAVTVPPPTATVPESDSAEQTEELTVQETTENEIPSQTHAGSSVPQTGSESSEEEKDDKTFFPHLLLIAAGVLVIAVIVVVVIKTKKTEKE